MDFGRKILTWYDRSLQLWTAIYQTAAGDQLGVAGYGTSKHSAVGDLAYQNSIFQPCRSAITNTNSAGD